MTRHGLRTAMAATLVGACLSLCGVTAVCAGTLSPALARIVAAANKEGTLKLTWSATTLGGAAGAKEIEAAMNAAFGTKLDVEFSAGPNMGRVGQRLMLEMKAGHQASVDAYLGSDLDQAAFVPQGLFRAEPWTQLLPARIEPEMVKGNGAVVLFATYVQGIAYNTQLLPHPPQTLQGFLDPSLKGRFALNVNAVGFDVLGSDEFWGKAKALAFAKQLSKAGAGLMRCGDVNRLASGEYAAFLLDCGAGDIITVRDRGAPVAHAIARDYAPIGFFCLSVPKNAAHPNAGAAFVAFMLTQEGQALAWKLWRNDLHYFPGSHSGQMLEAARKDGVTPKEVPFDFPERHPDANLFRQEVAKIFAQR